MMQLLTMMMQSFAASIDVPTSGIPNYIDLASESDWSEEGDDEEAEEEKGSGGSSAANSAVAYRTYYYNRVKFEGNIPKYGSLDPSDRDNGLQQHAEWVEGIEEWISNNELKPLLRKNYGYPCSVKPETVAPEPPSAPAIAPPPPQPEEISSEDSEEVKAFKTAAKAAWELWSNNTDAQFATWKQQMSNYRTTIACKRSSSKPISLKDKRKHQRWRIKQRKLRSAVLRSLADNEVMRDAVRLVSIDEPACGSLAILAVEEEIAMSYDSALGVIGLVQPKLIDMDHIPEMSDTHAVATTCSRYQAV